jgi:4-aminobutyrate aminotransferase / (S)-3-amino-2-methylpropionate transaminase / 5-aminovalerate transaminase
MTVVDEKIISGVVQERRLVTEVPGPRSRQLFARRETAVARGVSVMLPAFIVDAGGGVLVDADGNSLLDLGSGIAVTSVGNAAPRVVEGVIGQVERLTHACFMITPYEGYVAVAEELNRRTPGDFDKRTALFNSGAEAVENAVKIARAATGRSAVVVVEHAYHGRTNLAMALTAKSMPYKHSFGPFAPEVYRVPTSYPFRDGRSGEAAAAHAISRMEKEIGASSIACVVVEPIQGEGGFIVPARGFLPALSAWCSNNDVPFVADEIQTGIGRTGRWFASEHEDVVPDLVAIAKGVAGGLPLSAVTGRADLMDAAHVGGLGGTYGGNPVACAAALGALRTIEEEGLLDRATLLGERMQARLKALQADHPVIGDVRGRGAMQAIELVRPGTIDPAPDVAAAVAKDCHAQGVVVLTCGTYGNVLRFLPPLVMPEHLLEDAFDVVAEAVRAVAA